MSVQIALLRAVNVGGRAVPMEALRTMLTDLGCRDVLTLLQSGNAVFNTTVKTRAATFEAKLEAEAERRFGFEIAFVLRGADEWRDIIGRNPFAGEAKRDPARLHLMALKAAPTGAAIAALRQAHTGPERFEVVGRDAFIVYPNGAGRSKLTNAFIERKLGVVGTARNWNTVVKLAELTAA
ncbi:MAG TPA: DUF1697 domain-containing protein [Rudaea sp.]|nr:DUF1697 domain-containing protein [Rudaea sp.]